MADQAQKRRYARSGSLERKALVEAIAVRVKAGSGIEKAAESLGVNGGTIIRWLKEDPASAELMREASKSRDDRRALMAAGDHGKAGYKRGCRCAQCRAANAAEMRHQRQKRLQKTTAAAIPATVKHGANCYLNWGCRCDVCVAAAAVVDRPHQQKYRERHRGRLNARQRAKRAAEQARSLETARRYGYEWTGPELELAGRKDLTATQVAAMIGRTVAAVMTARRRLKGDPKFINLAGLSRDHGDLG